MAEKHKIDEVISQMHALAEHLIPFSYPVVDYSEEQDVLILKQRTIVVDGYDVVICLSRAKYEEEGHYLTTLQIQSVNFLFLPFYLVGKLGKLFLGEEHIYYVDFFKGFSKVYCWVVQDNFDGERAALESVNNRISFEDFEFNLIDKRSVNLY